MQRRQLSLMSILILSAAAPIWLLLIVIVPQSTAWGGGITRYFVAPFVLTGITIAVHWLLRGRRDAWAIAALAAALIALGTLSVAAWLAN